MSYQILKYLPDNKVTELKIGFLKAKYFCILYRVMVNSFFQGVVVDHCGLFFSSKVDQMQDIVTGNPAVIKIVVHFNR